MKNEASPSHTAKVQPQVLKSVLGHMEAIVSVKVVLCILLCNKEKM